MKFRPFYRSERRTWLCNLAWKSSFSLNQICSTNQIFFRVFQYQVSKLRFWYHFWSFWSFSICSSPIISNSICRVTTPKPQIAPHLLRGTEHHHLLILKNWPLFLIKNWPLEQERILSYLYWKWMTKTLTFPPSKLTMNNFRHHQTTGEWLAWFLNSWFSQCLKLTQKVSIVQHST